MFIVVFCLFVNFLLVSVNWLMKLFNDIWLYVKILGLFNDVGVSKLLCLSIKVCLKIVWDFVK